MKHSKLSMLFVFVFISGLFLPTLLSAKIYEQTAENFIILYDTSSSMEDEFMDSGMTKLYAAKNALKKLNMDIPELDYKAGLYLFTPFKPVAKMDTYSKASFNEAIEDLPVNLQFNGFFSGPTPLGKGIKSLDSILSNLTGKTVIYLFSDGGNTYAIDPAKEAAKLQEKYDICFSIVSLADSERGNNALDGIASLSQCSKVARVDWLNNDMDLATNEVFIAKAEPVMESQPAVELQPVEAYSPPDSDSDGISDDLDKCQSTPMAFTVDANGCPIQEPMMSEIMSFEVSESSMDMNVGKEIKTVGNYLNAHPEAMVMISGHADNIGNEVSNMTLSKQRAMNVYNYLKSNYNIDEEQIKVHWFGETKPVATNDTEEGRRQNRSVQIQIKNAYKLK